MRHLFEAFLSLPIEGQVTIVLGLFVVAWCYKGELLLKFFSLIPTLIKGLFLCLYFLIEIPVSILHGKFGSIFGDIDQKWTTIVGNICNFLDLVIKKMHNPQKIYRLRIFVVCLVISALLLKPQYENLKNILFNFWQNIFIEKEEVSMTVTEPNDSSVTENVEPIDLEATIQQIGVNYYEISNGINSNLYDITKIEEGITAYSEQDRLKAIIVEKGYEEYNYRRYLFYDGDKLFFAYYEGSDSHRLYIDKDQLIRWIYWSDVLDSRTATTVNMENTTLYLQWNERVRYDAYYMENKWRESR